MFKREMKVNFKNFIIWLAILLGLFLVVFLIYPSIVNSENIKMMDEMIDKEGYVNDFSSHSPPWDLPFWFQKDSER